VDGHTYGFYSIARDNVGFVEAAPPGADATTLVDTDAGGSLQVTIEPQGARSAGAQWRRTGTAPWYNSGDTETGVVVGNYTVEFKPVSGWHTPATVNVTIEIDETTTASGTYAPRAAAIHVKRDATGNNNGSSWADAYVSLQSALGDALQGEEIWVASGVYLPGPSGRREATFQLRDGVEIYGGFIGTETNRSQRDLSAN